MGGALDMAMPSYMRLPIPPRGCLGLVVRGEWGWAVDLEVPEGRGGGGGGPACAQPPLPTCPSRRNLIRLGRWQGGRAGHRACGEERPNLPLPPTASDAVDYANLKTSHAGPGSLQTPAITLPGRQDRWA